MRRLLLCALLLPFAALAQPPADRWTFSLTPYLWLPNVDGTLNFSTPPGAGGNPTASVGPNDYLENLDFVLMLSGEARKGDWALLTDLIYLDFSDQDGAVKSVTGPGGVVQAPINTNTRTGLKGLVWQLAASRTVLRGGSATLEVLGGVRYAGIETELDWQFAGPVGLMPQSGRFSQETDLWDAIIGVRGKARLGTGGAFVPYYLDAGAGSSKLTWQAVTGIGYTFKWGDALLAYRHLFYDQEDGKLIQQMRFSGPALAATFRF